MASGIAKHDPRQEDSAHDRYIQDQLRKTGNNVKAVDLVSGLMIVAAGVLGYLLLMALVDQWVVPGGLGGVTRFLSFAVLLAAAGVFFVLRLLPVLIGRINPVYAAFTIERSSPSLKNSLVNFLLFRGNRRALPEPVYQAIQQQAARRLSAVPIDSVVDRSQLIRLGYVLLGVVLACGLYKVLSPKDPLVSAGRILMPWADIAPPTRVSIFDIQPGSTTVVHGERLVISAELHGVGVDEPVTLYYSSRDGQAVDRAIAMHVPQGDYLHRCTLREEESGIFEPLDYRIEAGDAISPTYHVEVVAAPTLLVESVQYDYPEYTRLSDRRIDGSGDITAIEGTRVTITARANGPIQSASLDFQCDGTGDLDMKADGEMARVSFTLALAEDRRTPRYSSYALRLTNQEGWKNRDPVEHKIEVTADLPPEIVLLSPSEPEVEVPLNGMVMIETQAVDPDFGLRRVNLQAMVGQRTVLDQRLLDEERRGQFVGKFRLVPSRLNLKVGDRVDYWAVAHDNKSPDANQAQTSRQRLIIVAPEKGAEQPNENQKPDSQTGEGQQQPQQDEQGPGTADPERSDEDQQPQDGQQQDGEQQPGEQQQKGDPGEQQSGGQAGEGEGEQKQSSDKNAQGGQPGQSGEKDAGGEPGEGQGGNQGVPSDGSDDGSAFDEMLKQLQREGQQNGKPDSKSGQDGDPSGKGAPDQGEGPKGDPKGERGQGQPSGEGKPAADPSEPTKDDSGSQGDGARSKGQGQQSERDKKGQQPGEQRPDAKGGDANKQKGDPGSGKPGSDDRGSPDPQNDITPSPDKQLRPQPGDPSSKDPAKSPAHGKRESDSDGSQGGDRSGGGEEGGGQKADRQGTGSAGQNTAADEGNGQAPESGDGDTSDKSGDDVKSDRSTGKPGEKQPGGTPDSKSTDSGHEAGRSKSGGKPSERIEDKPGDEKGPESDKTAEGPAEGDAESQDAGESGSQPGGGGEPIGGGIPGEDPSAPLADQPEPGGDDPNLDYARKATDLVLERLEDQLEKDRVDKDLLDRLGWTKDDMQRFVRRWQEMKQAARGRDESARTAQKELDESLRSLGLGRGDVRRRSSYTDDDLRNLRSGSQSPAPAEYAEQVKAYIRGTSQAKDGGK